VQGEQVDNIENNFLSQQADALTRLESGYVSRITPLKRGRVRDDAWIMLFATAFGGRFYGKEQDEA
jgi:hypothetical protein